MPYIVKKTRHKWVTPSTYGHECIQCGCRRTHNNENPVYHLNGKRFVEFAPPCVPQLTNVAPPLFPDKPHKRHLPVKFTKVDIDRAKIYAEEVSKENSEVWIIFDITNSLYYVDLPGMLRTFEELKFIYQNGKQLNSKNLKA